LICFFNISDLLIFSFLHNKNCETQIQNYPQ